MWKSDWVKEARKLFDVEARKEWDDSLRYNAENASGAGLEVRVTRTYDGVGLSRGRECKWCKERQCQDETYEKAYSLGAFERHPGCGCTIEYISRKGEKTYQAGKSDRRWLSEAEFERRVNYGLGNRTPTPQERNINAAIEMQMRDKKSLTLVDAIIKNHEALRYYTPESMMRRLMRAGYDIQPLTRSKSGFNNLSLEEGGGFKAQFGGDGQLRYHPSGGIHQEAYWTISGGSGGKHQYGLDGKERDFTRRLTKPIG